MTTNRPSKKQVTIIEGRSVSTMTAKKENSRVIYIVPLKTVRDDCQPYFTLAVPIGNGMAVQMPMTENAAVKLRDLIDRALGDLGWKLPWALIEKHTIH
jgi:hypothetical protein